MKEDVNWLKFTNEFTNRRDIDCMSCPLVFVLWLQLLTMNRGSGDFPGQFNGGEGSEADVTCKAKESPLVATAAQSNERVERERNLYLAKSYLAEVITADLREIIRGSAEKLVKENEIIEELQDRIRNYEDHIQCLEQLVKELQLMLRNSLGKEHSVSSDEGSVGSSGRTQGTETNRRNNALQAWFPRPLEDGKQKSPEVARSAPKEKRERMAHKTSKATHSSGASSEGVLDDFM